MVHLNGMEQYKICGTYSCAEDALSSVALKQCDILISDISLPGMNGLELIENFVSTALLSRGADCLVVATPMKARQINSGFGHQCC